MAYLPIQYSGSKGVVRDLQEHVMAPNVWSEIQNVRMDNNSATKMEGYSSVYETAQVAPWAVWYVPNPDTNWWVYCGASRIYATDGTTHYDITRNLATPGAPTLGESSGPLPNGLYKYKVTFVNANGETDGGTEASITTTIGPGAQVDMTNIPISTSGTTTARKIYRTVSGGTGDFYLVTTISDNTTTTYTDTMQDFTLTGNPVLPSSNTAREDYNADEDYGWNGGVLSGILILNNGIDAPQAWVPSSSNKCVLLSNWDETETCRVIRPFGNFLFALDITKSSVRYPYLIKWSHPADPGSVPSSWDETDATKLTGEYDLGDTPDKLVDCLPLRDVLVIYKERTQYTAQFIGGTFVFRLAAISKLDGMYTRRCAAEFRPGQHVVFTANDVVIHNGVTAQSIIDGENRKWLLDSINGDLYQRVFCFHYERYNEFWICFPEADATAWATRALVWNYREETWGDRALPEIADIKPGIVVDDSDDTWDSGQNITWDTVGDTLRWNAERDSPAVYRILMAYPAGPKLYWLGAAYTDDGTSYTAVLERTHLAIPEMGKGNSTTPNYESWKFLRGLRPRLYGMTNDSSSITIYVGTHNDLYDNPVWYGPYTFTPADEFKVDVTLSARLFALRIEMDGDEPIRLDGIDLDIEVEAEY